MKKRNTDCIKLRRPLKRNKIPDGFYGSIFLYLKFLALWAVVLMADFIMDFRFEYLWPFWLLVRSVCDSFKYQGLAFSVFFICIAITSDVICFLFIPVHWLFFAASTYVWVQYVWHTERGICLPTVSLWLLFVYIEVSVRLRELRTLPFQLDLCRPFAAHCIGYPVVTLGFGFKSYVSYRVRVRQQRDVQKCNDFYIQLLQKSLPSEQHPITPSEKTKDSSKKFYEEGISNGTVSSSKKSIKDPEKDWKQQNTSCMTHIEDYEFIQQTFPPAQLSHTVNDYIDPDIVCNHENHPYNKSNGVKNGKLNSQKDIASSGKKGKGLFASNVISSLSKDEYIQRLESDVRKLRSDLQLGKTSEHDLRSQVNMLVMGDKSLKNELYQLRQDNEMLQNKLHNLVTSRQQDKANFGILEKKLQDERKIKCALEQQLCSERKVKRAEEAAAARAIAMAASVTRTECTDSCKTRRKELDNEVKSLHRDMKIREDQIRILDREVQSLRQVKDSQNETEVLMSALAAMQDKNAHLENSLSAETKLKLDLFSALGEAKRRIEILQGVNAQKDQDVAAYKLKLAHFLALLPTSKNTSTLTQSGSPPPCSSKFTTAINNQEHVLVANSTLNPNASDYTPKGQ